MREESIHMLWKEAVSHDDADRCSISRNDTVLLRHTFPVSLSLKYRLSVSRSMHNE